MKMKSRMKKINLYVNTSTGKVYVKRGKMYEKLSSVV